MSVAFLTGNHGHNVTPVDALSYGAMLTLCGMADVLDTTLSSETGEISTPANLVEAMKMFASVHGGARAVVEYVGRRGARIVLVGEDGEWADHFTAGTDIAREACSSAGVPVETEWERELIEQMRPSNDLWRSMSRRVLAR
jgi:hypothetical protein